MAAKAKADDLHDLLMKAAWVSGVVAKSSKTPKLEDLIPRLKEQATIDHPDLFAAALGDISASLPKRSWEEIMIEIEEEKRLAE